MLDRLLVIWQSGGGFDANQQTQKGNLAKVNAAGTCTSLKPVTFTLHIRYSTRQPCRTHLCIHAYCTRTQSHYCIHHAGMKTFCTHTHTPGVPVQIRPSRTHTHTHSRHSVCLQAHHEHMHAHMNTYTQAHLHTCTHACTHGHMHTCMHTCMHKRVECMRIIYL